MTITIIDGDASLGDMEIHCALAQRAPRLDFSINELYYE